MIKESDIAHADIDEALTGAGLTRMVEAGDKYLRAKKNTRGVGGVLGRLGAIFGCKPCPDKKLEKARRRYLKAKGRYIRDKTRELVNEDPGTDDGEYIARLATNLAVQEIGEMHRLAERDHELNRPNVLQRIGGAFVRNPALRFATGMGLNVAIGLGVATGNIPAVGLALAARTALGAYGLKGAIDGIESIVHQRRGGRNDMHIPGRPAVAGPLPPAEVDRRRNEDRVYATRWINRFIKIPTSRMSILDYFHYRDAVGRYRDSLIDKFTHQTATDGIKNHTVTPAAPEAQPKPLVDSLKKAMKGENKAYVIQREGMNRRNIPWEWAKWAIAVGVSAAFTEATHPHMLHYVFKHPDDYMGHLIGNDRMSSLNGWAYGRVAETDPSFAGALTTVDLGDTSGAFFDPTNPHSLANFWEVYRNNPAAQQEHLNWLRMARTNLGAQGVLNGDLIQHTGDGIVYFNPADRGLFLPWHPENVARGVGNFFGLITSPLSAVAHAV